MKILLVEPDKILGQTAKTSLQANGHKVTLRTNAQTALDALDKNLPDMIILEIQLGIHNGIEFLYELRSYIEWQEIPVIVHTINAKILDERFGQALTQLGVMTLLYKPRTTLKKLNASVVSYMPV